MITALTANQVKDRTGTEVEFEFQKVEGRTVILQKSANANPSLPYTLKISHEETGTGINRVRRSVVRFDKTVNGQVDSTKTMPGSAYVVNVAPVGNMTDVTLMQDLNANLLSFCATTGAATTVLFDGTGTGCVCLTSGTN